MRNQYWLKIVTRLLNFPRVWGKKKKKSICEQVYTINWMVIDLFLKIDVPRIFYPFCFSMRSMALMCPFVCLGTSVATWFSSFVFSRRDARGEMCIHENCVWYFFLFHECVNPHCISVLHNGIKPPFSGDFVCPWTVANDASSSRRPRSRVRLMSIPRTLLTWKGRLFFE